PLTPVVGWCGGFGQGASLTAGDDSLKACAGSLDVRHASPHLMRAGIVLTRSDEVSLTYSGRTEKLSEM
ncbi:MAG: hypothetical protein WCD83_21860, partial [Pseudolabrys sp.]